MDKKRTRFTPFPSPRKMKLCDFCEKFGLDESLIMKRMNNYYWEDLDAIVSPEKCGFVPPYKVKQFFTFEKMGWKNHEIANRLNVSEDDVKNLRGLSEKEREIFEKMSGYEILLSEIDLEKIFPEKAG